MTTVTDTSTSTSPDPTSGTGSAPSGAAPTIADQVADYVALAGALEPVLPAVRAVADLLIERLGAGGTVYTLGNGGSAADAQHLTGELIGHYRRDRRPLRAVTLGADTVTASCIANDYDFATVFSRQVEALAGPADVVVAFSTSGASPNVVAALAAARANGAATVLLGGGDGGPAAAHAELALLVPASGTARVQEVHTLFLHLISEQIDAWAA